MSRGPKPAERRLRKRFADLMLAVDSSTAMQPFAHDLKVLLDPRSKSERIEAAVQQYIGALTHVSTGAVTGALQKRLARVLTRTSLEQVPCDKAIRKCLVDMQENGTSGDQIPRSSFDLTYASTVQST